MAVLGRAYLVMAAGFRRCQARLPFAVVVLHPDNGSESLNDLILTFWHNQPQTPHFSRSRPYQKNDNAHVEQKNWTCVRRVFGYQRIDTPEQVAFMNALYRGPLRLYTNFFQPVLKCIAKQRVGSRVKRQYDRARPPFQRILESSAVPAATKAALRSQYGTLNPLALRREIAAALTRISSLRRQQVTAVVPLKQPLTFEHIPCTAR